MKSETATLIPLHGAATMPRPTLSIAGAGAPASVLDRRGVMSLFVASACLPAVALADSALVPPVTNDPIFAAIEEHRKSWEAYKACVTEQAAAEVSRDEFYVNRTEAAIENEWLRLEAASWELCRASISSLGGAAALCRYAATHIAEGGFWPDAGRDWNLAMHRHVASALDEIVAGLWQA